LFSAFFVSRLAVSWCFVVVDKWSTPIMGYLGGSDTLNQVWTHMAVESKEDAIRIAERNGACASAIAQFRWDW
jgi:hypothetical protein